MYSKLIVNIFYYLRILNPQTFIEQEEESVCKMLSIHLSIY